MRGHTGISLALAFSLTENMSGSAILLLTYGLVIFSILVQGLTLPKVVKAPLDPITEQT